MIPYAKHEVTEDDKRAVMRVLDSPYLTQGPEVEQFEQAIADKLGYKHVICCSSGTAALWLMFRTLPSHTDLRIVTVPSNTFIATPNMAFRAGLHLISQDIDDMGMGSGDFYDIFCHVSFAGQPFTGVEGQRPSIVDLAQPVLVVDAAHAFGADVAIGYGGALAATFSFHPSKTIATGDGGAVVTNNDEFALLCRILRDHGRHNGRCIHESFNFRMNEMAAALGRSQLDRLDDYIGARRRLASRYDEMLDGLDVAVVPHLEGSVYHLYQIRVDPARRDEIRMILYEDYKIGTQIHYLPWHNEPVYAGKASKQPNAERFGASVITIPLFPTMTEAEQDEVVYALTAVT